MSVNKHSGVSLVELVMVLVILAVLAATAIPKLFDKNRYAERAFFDDTLNAVRYAQKLAVATGCGVQVSVSGNRYTLTRRGDTTSLSCPTSGAAYTLPVTDPSSGASGYSGGETDVTLTSSVSPFVFNALGAASADVVLTVNGSKTINVIAETGFVYDSTP